MQIELDTTTDLVDYRIKEIWSVLQGKTIKNFYYAPILLEGPNNFLDYSSTSQYLMFKNDYVFPSFLLSHYNRFYQYIIKINERLAFQNIYNIFGFIVDSGTENQTVETYIMDNTNERYVKNQELSLITSYLKSKYIIIFEYE